MDTGCTDTIVWAERCQRWKRCKDIQVTTMGGDLIDCCGMGQVTVETGDRRVRLEALVVPSRPMGVDAILGMTGISAMGGVSVRAPADVRFCAAAERRPPLSVEAPDFTARFDATEKAWIVSWKWARGEGPKCLDNKVAQYAVPAAARQQFQAELDAWIADGWLQRYDEETDGRPRGLLPLMAVIQDNQAKVRPVMDYRELNQHVDAHTADADVCADQLRKWRRQGSRIAVVDLRKAYLQLRLDRRLWPYQTVVVRGQRYCLTRLGFGLNVAPLVMKAVVRAVLSQDPDVEKATVPFVDDLLVNEDIVSAERVVEHFAAFGLECKPPKRAADGARLLGLSVRSEAGALWWSRDSSIALPPAKLTRRAMFAWCGRLVAHLPVCGWLRPAVAWLKRRVNAVTRGWDDVTDDAALWSQVEQVAGRLARADPARGPWCFSGERAIVWTDASSIASGVVIQSPEDGVVEDACWLRGVGTTAHINMAELDAAVRGLNLAISWGVKIIDLRTDSATVHRWIDDALSGRTRLRTKAHGEMLIRRRVDVIRQLVEEMQLQVTVSLVKSADNLADALTRVPKQWLSGPEVADGVPGGSVMRQVRLDAAAAGGSEPAKEVGVNSRQAAAVVCSGDAGGRPGVPERGGSVINAQQAGSVECGRGANPPDQMDEVPQRGGIDECDAIRAVHERAGHPGIRRTMYFAKREISRDVTRAAVREVVSSCDVCRSIDPAPVRWEHGSLGVSEPWARVAIDVTHYQGRSYLSLIDCGPSRYSLWRQLRRADASEVARHLEDIFLERGAPVEILADNDTAFRSRLFAAFVSRWRVSLRFRAVHEPGGNGIVERCHRTIKVIAARRQCSIAEAVHLYNITPRDGEEASSAPAAGIFQHPVRDCVRPPAEQCHASPPQQPPPTLEDAPERAGPAAPDRPPPPQSEDRGRGGNPLSVGQKVWMRQPGTRCTVESRRGVITRVVSPQVREVDGVPWHVRDLRPRREEAGTDTGADDGGGDEVLCPLFVTGGRNSEMGAPQGPVDAGVAAEETDERTGDSEGEMLQEPSAVQPPLPVLRRSERLQQMSQNRN